jgi:tRNA pseudouridine38-40 synthase
MALGLLRTIKLTIAYDGTGYAGWQRQTRRRKSGTPAASALPTIQEALEHALESVLRHPVQVIGSGRTDAGAHAAAQIAHLKTSSRIPASQLARALNHLLPETIAVTAAADAPSSFHARRAAVSKLYRYRIYTGRVVPPFIRRYVHHARSRLNIRLMREELRGLEGVHDFRGFARAGHGRATTRRAILRARLRRSDDELYLDILGDGFLHAMVRSIAGTLIDVGRGRLPGGTVRKILRTGDRRLAGTTAPAHGLILLSVQYAARTEQRARRARQRLRRDG